MIRCICAMLVSALLLWGGFSLYALTGDRYQQIIPGTEVLPDIVNWQMMVGEGGVGEDGFAMMSGERGAPLLRLGIRLPQTVIAETVEKIKLEFAPGAQYRRMTIGWGSASTFEPARRSPVQMVDATRGVVQVDRHPRWSGEIRFLALDLAGGTTEPVMLRRVELLPARPGFLTFQKRLFGEWFSFPPWTQRSTHFTMVALHDEILSPSIAIAVWIALSLLLTILSFRFAGRAILSPVLLLPLALGWALLDLRWQANLVVRAVDAVETFAGQSWDEKRTGHFDGELFEFMRDLKDTLGGQVPRIFALGHSEFWRLRARYHAVPWSVRTTNRSLEHDWVSRLRSGDLLLLLDTPHVQEHPMPEIDAAQMPEGPGEIPLTRAAGEDVQVGLEDGQSVLSLQGAQGELVSTRFPLSGQPVAYRAEMEVAGHDGPASIRLRVRRQAADGPAVTIFERLVTTGDADLEIVQVPFVANKGALYELTVTLLDGAGLSVASVRVDTIDEEGLIYLHSGADGPMLLVRPVKSAEIATAYEIL